MTLTIIFALAAALSNAIHLMTQHTASAGVTHEHRNWHLVRHLIRQPLWLLGWAAAAGGFAFQAVALHGGQLAVVQALLVTELVFALLLRRFWVRQHIAKTAWTAAVVTSGALVVFLSTAEPHGGTCDPIPPMDRRLSGLRRDRGRVGAGGTLGIPQPPRLPVRHRGLDHLGPDGRLIKATTDVPAHRGVLGTLEHWPLYALIVAAVVGSVLQQAALQVGPLSVSQPLIVVVDPAVAIVLSAWIFDALHGQRAPEGWRPSPSA